MRAGCGLTSRRLGITLGGVPLIGLVRSFEAAHPEIAIDSDVWIHRGAGDAGIAVERTPGSAGPQPADALQSSFTAWLTAADAAQLRAELAALRDRWVGRASGPSEGQASYLTVLALTPVDRR